MILFEIKLLLTFVFQFFVTLMRGKINFDWLYRCNYQRFEAFVWDNSDPGKRGRPGWNSLYQNIKSFSILHLFATSNYSLTWLRFLLVYMPGSSSTIAVYVGKYTFFFLF